MASVSATAQRLNNPDGICFLLVSVLWAAFFMAGLNLYLGESNLAVDFKDWLPLTIAGRLVLLISAIAGLAAILLDRQIFTFSTYAVLGSSVQAFFSYMESANSIEFYQYIPLFHIAGAAVFRSNQSIFYRLHLPIILMTLILPLLSKDLSGINDLTTFVYIYTTPLSLSAVAFLVYFYRVQHVAIRRENAALTTKLIEEKENNLQQEVVLRKKIQAELEETAFKLKEEEKAAELARLVQMIAHDIRRPFSSLKMLLKAFSGSTSSEGDAIERELVDEAFSQISSAEILIDDVLEINRRGQLHKKSFDVAALSQKNVQTIKNCFPDKKNLFLNESYQEGLIAMIDRDKISRVFQNVLSNAFEAVDENGSIWITAKKVDSQNKIPVIEVTIGNSGSFIEPENLSKIFDLYYSQGKKSGTGLGLAIAKKVIADHGGSIHCISDRTKGVEFTFSIPASDAP